MASAAAARLQALLQGFISHNADHGVKKLVPDSCGETPSYTMALDAAEMLENLPFYAASLQPLLRSGSTAVFTKVQTGGTSGDIESAAFAPILQFLGGAVERHLRTFMQGISTGPSFMNLGSHTSKAHTLTSSESSFSSEGVLSVEAATPSFFDGGPRVNFVAWVALEVYRNLAAEAEASLRERRQVGCGADALDAAVRTDAYVQWQRALRERLLTALPLHAAKEVDVSNDSSAAVVEGHLNQNKVAAASGRLPLDAYDNADDLFTSEPHFFSSFMRKLLLPQLKPHVTGDKVGEERAGLAAEMRHWMRFPTPITSLSATSGGCHDVGIQRAAAEQGEEDHHRSSVPLPTRLHWARLVQLLLGSSIAPVLSGSAVYEANGLLRPQIPAQVAAYVASAVMVFLVPGVVSSMARWLDQMLSSSSRDCVSALDVDVEQRMHDGEGCVEAVHHVLDVCMRSVQVVPFPLCDDRDAALYADAQVAGEWLLPLSSSAAAAYATPSLSVSRRETDGKGVNGWRRAVVLPGLSIAVTRISSVACESPASEQSGTGLCTAPGATTPAGTCVASPAHALAQLLVNDAQLDAATISPCCDASHATTTTTVSALHESSLCSVEGLLLFTEWPNEVEQLERILASVNASVISGWVVFVVQASVAKATQSWVESTWGSVERPVLLLSAVGQWGLQQLTLRFDVEANTPFTDPRALRCVWRGAQKSGRAGSCGVAALLLHSHKCTRSLTKIVTDVQDVMQGAVHGNAQRRQQILYTESREQLLFVVGAVTYGEAENIVRDGANDAKQPTKYPDVQTLSQSSCVAQRPTTSMFFAETSEEEEDEEATCSSDLRTGRTSSSSNFSTHSSHTTLSSRERTRCKMMGWYSDAEVPALPYVTRSVLLGAVTRGAQRELVYCFWHWWRLLLHRLVLPHDLSIAVDAQGPWSANVAAIRYLDAYAHSGGSAEAKCTPTPEPPGAGARNLRHLHVLRVLREALWSYELIAMQHDGEGQRVDEAWAALQQSVVDGDTAGKPMPRPTTTVEGYNDNHSEHQPLLKPSSESTESWLQVQSAYVALGNCMDDLCRTVVLAAEAESEEGVSTDITDLAFLPIL